MLEANVKLLYTIQCVEDPPQNNRQLGFLQCFLELLLVKGGGVLGVYMGSMASHLRSTPIFYTLWLMFFPDFYTFSLYTTSMHLLSAFFCFCLLTTSACCWATFMNSWIACLSLPFKILVFFVKRKKKLPTTIFTPVFRCTPLIHEICYLKYFFKIEVKFIVEKKHQ